VLFLNLILWVLLGFVLIEAGVESDSWDFWVVIIVVIGIVLTHH